MLPVTSIAKVVKAHQTQVIPGAASRKREREKKREREREGERETERERQRETERDNDCVYVQLFKQKIRFL